MSGGDVGVGGGGVCKAWAVKEFHLHVGVIKRIMSVGGPGRLVKPCSLAPAIAFGEGGRGGEHVQAVSAVLPLWAACGHCGHIFACHWHWLQLGCERQQC